MFIGRKADNSIYGLWTVRQWKDQEELPDDDPQVTGFPILNNAETALKGIATIERTRPITPRLLRELTLVLWQIVQALIAKINALDAENVTLIGKINALDAEVAVLAARAPAPMTPRIAAPLPGLDPPPYGVGLVAQVDAQIVALRDQL